MKEIRYLEVVTQNDPLGDVIERSQLSMSEGGWALDDIRYGGVAVAIIRDTRIVYSSALLTYSRDLSQLHLPLSPPDIEG